MDIQQPEPQYDSPSPQKDNKGLAIAALVLGILNLCSWFFPLCGFPMGIGGVICGVLGLKSSSRVMAIVGIVLSAICLVLSLINAIAGVVMGLNPSFTNNFLQGI
jgi:hypothetical protein